MAPFWSDNDIRRDGAVRYATYSVNDNENPQGERLMQFLNGYIQRFQAEDEDPFEGQWLLTAHWDNVHPSPHGEEDHRGIPEELLELVCTLIMKFSYESLTCFGGLRKFSCSTVLVASINKTT